MNYMKIALGMIALLGSVLIGVLCLWLGYELIRYGDSANGNLVRMFLLLLILFPAPLLASATLLLFSGHEKADGAEMYFLLAAALCLGQSIAAIYLGWGYLWADHINPVAIFAFVAFLAGLASVQALARHVKI